MSVDWFTSGHTVKLLQIKQTTVTCSTVWKLDCCFTMGRYRTSKPVTEFRNKSYSNSRIISNLRPAPCLNPWHKTADNSVLWETTAKRCQLLRWTIRKWIHNTFIELNMDCIPLHDSRTTKQNHLQETVLNNPLIHSFCSLSYDSSIASSKASYLHSAIQCLRLQFPVSSRFLKVIQ
jgi:hypothetical protein